MGRRSRSSTSPPPLDEKKSPEGSENVVVEVIEAQARVEDSQVRNEDPAFEEGEVTLTPVELGKDYHRTTNKEGVLCSSWPGPLAAWYRNFIPEEYSGCTAVLDP